MRYPTLDALPYERIYSVDFEYENGGVAGNNPRVVCLVVREFRTGAVKRYWRDALLEMTVAPFDIGPDTLVVAYFAPAEMQCFMALGWPRPENLIDPFAEFRRLTNGQYPEHGHGLVGALRYFGLDSFVPAQKEEMRQLILSGGPWSEAQQTAILDYCESDVDALEPLLAAMELCLNLGDAHHQAARFLVSLVTSTPSLNLIPSITFGN